MACSVFETVLLVDPDRADEPAVRLLSWFFYLEDEAVHDATTPRRHMSCGRRSCLRGYDLDDM